jgi:hypothetical protein
MRWKIRGISKQYQHVDHDGVPRLGVDGQRLAAGREWLRDHESEQASDTADPNRRRSRSRQGNSAYVLPITAMRRSRLAGGARPSSWTRRVYRNVSHRTGLPFGTTRFGVPSANSNLSTGTPSAFTLKPHPLSLCATRHSAPENSMVSGGSGRATYTGWPGITVGLPDGPTRHEIVFGRCGVEGWGDEGLFMSAKPILTGGVPTRRLSPRYPATRYPIQ